MLIDTHCHLDFPDFDADRDIVIKEAQKAGVGFFINVSSSFEGSKSALRLSKTFDQVYASVGVHPHDAKDCSSEQWPALEALLLEDKVVAIGEVGLDFYRNLSEPVIQVEVFRKFISLAERSSLPLIVHSRLAADETLAILREYPRSGSTGVVIHCFSGDMDFLKNCLDLGFFVSFTCNVTYKKADAIREVLKFVPLDRMFLETDAPYLSPEGKRGKRNEPANLPELAREVSRLKQIDFDEVCAETTKNARKFFRI